ncbi:glutamate--cysteine ligase [Cellulomonas sp. P22]|uniref:glutamate--cysteine ligase n=1 Tax=Cellulomonas sp. P22 TaxID=3373189 RepID=UPI00378989B6
MRSIGIEEEFLLVAPDGSLRAVAAPALQHAAAHASDAVAGEQPGGTLEKEFTQEQVETSTRPSTDRDGLLAEVRTGRARADASAQHVGARVVALATAPRGGDPTVIANQRARAIRHDFGEIAREQLTCGCHVHVEVGDDDEGVQVIDHLRPWTPLLLALSANSPYWHGEDTAYASYRSQVWGRWPTAGPTSPFGSAQAYHDLVDVLVGSGTILDPGMVYFDARLSPRYPTVEVRVPDVCLDAADAVLQGLLVRALADTALDPELTRSSPTEPAPRTEILRLAAWRAARSGVTGDLLSPLTARAVPAGDAIAELVEHVRPALERTGDLEWVQNQVREVLGRGTGSVQQRRWRAEGADDAAFMARAVERTHA